MQTPDMGRNAAGEKAHDEGMGALWQAAEEVGLTDHMDLASRLGLSGYDLHSILAGDSSVTLAELGQMLFELGFDVSIAATPRPLYLWVDDVRDVPQHYAGKGAVVARTAAEAITVLQQGRVTHISLDHDLGAPEAGTGYDVAVWIEKQAVEGKLRPLQWEVHSANPVGAERIRQALRQAEKHW